MAASPFAALLEPATAAPGAAVLNPGDIAIREETRVNAHAGRVVLVPRKGELG
jgi:hypothetical protein